MSFFKSKKNSAVCVLWGILTLFSIVFNNHTTWLLFFFMTPLLIILLVQAILPVSFTVNENTSTRYVTTEEALPISLYITKNPLRIPRRFVYRIKLSTRNILESQSLLSTHDTWIQCIIPNITLKRGVYPVKNAALVTSDFFGIFESGRRDVSFETLYVLPKQAEEAASVTRFLEAALINSSAYQNLETYDLRSVREYVPGDALNHIDWKLTSKSNALIMRQYEHEAQRPLTFIYVPTASSKFEPMLSLFMTIERSFRNQNVIQFKLLLDTLKSPTDADYAQMQPQPEHDHSIISQDAVYFSAERLSIPNSRQGQIYYDHDLLIYEHANRRTILSDRGEA